MIFGGDLQVKNVPHVEQVFTCCEHAASNDFGRDKKRYRSALTIVV